MAHDQNRRDLLLTSLLMAMPLAASAAVASPLNPAQTIIKMKDDLAWKSDPANPERSVDMSPLFGRRIQRVCITRWCDGGRAI